MSYRLLFALLATVVVVRPADAHGHEKSALVIGHAWARPVAAGRPVAAAYLSITNNGRVAETLTGASTPQAGSVQVHQTTWSEGMARMRPLQELVIEPGQTVRIEPGGIHLMLMDLKGPLLAGTTVPLILTFRVSGDITVSLNIEAHDAWLAPAVSVGHALAARLDDPLEEQEADQRHEADHQQGVQHD
jgi:copper(I)-binding protein